MRAVNLLPKDDPRARRGMPSPWVLLSAAAPLVAGSLVYFGYSTEHSSVIDKRAELTAVQSRLAALTPSLASAAAETGLVSQRSTRQAALQDALAKEMPWNLTLDDLARVLPKDVWLTSLSAQSPTPAGTAAVATAPAAPGLPTSFTLNGYAHTQADVADLLARLSLLPMLNDVTLASTTTTTSASATAGGTGQSFVQFEVAAGLQKPVPRAAP